MNIQKSKKKLGWKPKLTIDECISITVDWYKEVMTNKKSVEKITKDQILNYMNVNDKKIKIKTINNEKGNIIKFFNFDQKL